jgi:hypothetical protein
VRLSSVDTGFGTVRVHRYGTADGEPVVLLHGHVANASTWYPQFAGLGLDRVHLINQHLLRFLEAQIPTTMRWSGAHGSRDNLDLGR